MSLPLWFIGLPLIFAGVTLGLWSRPVWQRSVALAVLVACGLRGVSSGGLVDGRLLTVGSMSFVADSRAVGLVAFVAHILIVFVVWQWWRPARPIFVPATLAVFGLLAAMLMVRPLPFSAPLLALLLGGLGVLAYEQRRAGYAATRILLTVGVLGMALLLAANALLAGNLVHTAKWWLLAAIMVLLAGFPLFFWFPLLAQQLRPLRLFFFVGVVHIGLTSLLYRWLMAAPLLWVDGQFSSLLRWSGVATAVLAGLLALQSGRLSWLLAHLLLLDMSSTLLALSLPDPVGWETAVALYMMRLLALVLVLVGVAWLCGQRRDVVLADVAGWGRQRPLATALFAFGAFSLVGLPLTLGFSSRWMLATAVLVQGSGAWLMLLLLLGMILAALAVIRWLAALLRPVITVLPDGTVMSNWQRQVTAVLLLLSLLLSAFPQLCLYLAHHLQLL